jgi:N-acetyl-1-D-myo-inositol-2-amino-2-deoxy-alpha-D-glucopyranoside deacetylase
MTAASAPLAAAGEHLVVVVAHPDDETFGCGSLIAHAADAGATVTVICATRGEAGERVPSDETDHLPLGDVRERELFAAAAVLGVDAVELLSFVDSGWDGPIAPGTLCAAPIEDVADLLARRLKASAATVVVIIDGSDGHRDHLHIRRAVEHALGQMASPPRLVQLGLSRQLMRRWVDEMRARSSDTVYLDLDVDTLGTADELLTPIDVSQYLATRERGIACHRSQTSPYEGLSPELRRAFLSTDFVRKSTPS